MFLVDIRHFLGNFSFVTLKCWLFPFHCLPPSCRLLDPYFTPPPTGSLSQVATHMDSLILADPLGGQCQGLAGEPDEREVGVSPPYCTPLQCPLLALPASLPVSAPAWQPNSHSQLQPLNPSLLQLLRVVSAPHSCRRWMYPPPCLFSVSCPHLVSGSFVRVSPFEPSGVNAVSCCTPTNTLTNQRVPVMPCKMH